MNNQYAVSIRHIYTMPDETFNGYELVLWHWDVIENTWLFRATRDYPISKRVSRGYALWKVLRDAQKLARILGVFEELLNEGWQILRVDTMPPTELRNNAVAATNVYILEREANDD